MLDRGRGRLLRLLDPGRLVRPVKEFGGSRSGALPFIHRTGEPAGVGFLVPWAIRVGFRVSRLRPQNP